MKRNKKKVKKPPWTDVWNSRNLFLVSCALLLCPIVWGLVTLYGDSTLPFKQIHIVSAKHFVHENALRNTVLNNLHGGFFSLDAMSLRKRILQNPWIRKVSLRRVWPDHLEVEVEEQKPVARWNGNQVVNSFDELFSPKKSPNALPSLNGPVDKFITVLQRYHLFQTILAPLHKKISSLTLGYHGRWSLVLDGRIKVFIGRENIEKRMMKFAQYFPRIVGVKSQDVEHVDLRYPNGMAVKWQTKAKN